MKTLKLTMLFCLSIMFAFSFTSCGGSSGPGGVDCEDSIAVNSAISDEVQGISNAANVYANDPSVANCDKLKAAYQNYIDALKDLQDCANDAGVGDEFAQSLADAELSIDDLVC